MKVINFMSQRKLAVVISILLLVASIGSLATRQLNWGLDFTGGTLVEVNYSATAQLSDIRNILETQGYAGATVVSFGSDRDVLIRLPQGYSDQQGVALLGILQEEFTGGQVVLRRMEFVGPQVGDELREQGGLAMLLALFLVTLYIGFRFQLKFALGAVAALVHDVIITLGFFSLTGMEFNLTVLAAVLAVVGYSINDTIVVFDRIRENFRKLRRTEPVDAMNISISETLGRTLVTSGTTLLTVVSLALFGGEMIFGFAVALIVGITIGTYSSIYVASATALALGVTKEDLMLPVKEGAEQDELTP
ncbi:MAG: protein translocase subunit SecF [Halioglobus sp.]|jgi:preprotein translocase subunit SecF|nr:protein translocase subunit SecF [Halioglobus sp.]